jgi:hypothetical protein
MGEKSERKRGATTFEFWLSLFADDCALFFNTRSVRKRNSLEVD